MARAAREKTDFAPAIGRMPVLQFMAPVELAIDPAYQWSIEGVDSQRLIRAIAQDWNWDLCLPLVVSRRDDGGHYVLDGQHRLEAARLRGDIAHLPCVVGNFAGQAGEAATFVALNAKRRPLCKIDIFKAAVASGDAEAVEIDEAIRAAGLSVAPHSNHMAWKAGMIAHIGGIEQVRRRHGLHVAAEALQCLSTAFAGQVMQYAGTIYPGIAAVCAAECTGERPFAPDRFARFTAHLGKLGQQALRRKIVLKATEPGFSRTVAAIFVVRGLWAGDPAPPVHPVAKAPPPAAPPSPAPVPVTGGQSCGQDRFDLRANGKADWCSQCEQLRTAEQAKACTSRFCKLAFAA